MQMVMDRLLLHADLRRPDHEVGGGALDAHAVHLFAAGVPLVEALDSVGGAAGNAVYAKATEQIQRDVRHRHRLTRR
jgi:type IV pilus assembly protein PilC